MNIACVASVFVGLSAGLKLFLLFERAKIEASAKKCISVAHAPIFAPPKSKKCLELEVNPTEMPRTGGKTYGNA